MLSAFCSFFIFFPCPFSTPRVFAYYSPTVVVQCLWTPVESRGEEPGEREDHPPHVHRHLRVVHHHKCESAPHLNQNKSLIINTYFNLNPETYNQTLYAMVRLQFSSAGEKTKRHQPVGWHLQFSLLQGYLCTKGKSINISAVQSLREDRCLRSEQFSCWLFSWAEKDVLSLLTNEDFQKHNIVRLYS